MRRLVFWVFFAALLHSGLLLVPLIEPTASQSAVSTGVAVRINKAAPTKQEPEKVETVARSLTEVVEEQLPTPSFSENKPTRQETKTLSSAPPTPARDQATEPVVKREVSKPAIEPETLTETVAAVSSPQTRSEPVKKALSGAEVHTKSPQPELSDQVDLALAKSKAAQEEPLSIEARPLSGRKPKYPRRAIVRNQQGLVSVELLIRADGFVEHTRMLQSSGYDLLDRSVMKFVDKERFIAALEEGVPVSSTQLFTFRFVLR